MVSVKITKIKEGVRVHHVKYGFGITKDDSKDTPKKGEVLVEFENGTDRIDLNSGDGTYANWSRFCKSDIVKISDIEFV